MAARCPGRSAMARVAVLLLLLFTLGALGPSSAAAAAATADGRPLAAAIPQAVVSGSCGSATLTVAAGPGSGVATVTLRVASSWGPILAAGWSVRWQNASSGQSGSYSGSQLVFSDVLLRADRVWTGRGLVTIWLASLDATLWWGAACRGLGPLEQAWIP